jgi:uncharacterized membrane protein YphA (DoxX/SURF4 family)
MPRPRASSSKPSHKGPPPPLHPRALVLRLVLGVVYLVALSGLIVWEYRDHLDLGSSCQSADTAAKPAFYTYPYRRFLDWAHADSASEVSVVAIPSNLEDIQNNVCLARSYLADMLRSIALQHPAEIVIDKFYGPTACVSSPQSTAELLSVVQSLSVPVIIGESTNKTDTQVDGSCLVRKPQLDFQASNVRHGLTRVNVDSEKVPLQWSVLPSEPATPAAAPAQPHPQDLDSLSWAAVKAYDPAFAQRPRIQALIDTGRHPYAKLTVDLPRETSTDLLCDAGTPAMRQRWSIACPGPGHRINLLGRVVVIGAEEESDRRTTLGMDLWGVDLQARYIQAMLSGSYLRSLPLWVSFSLFAGFIFIIEGLPTLMEAFRPHWRNHPLFSRAFQRRRYVWVLFWSVIVIVLSTVIALALGYLPPLAVFGDIFLVVVTRLLFFAAESTETPFLHPTDSHPAHSKGAS